MVKVQDSLKDQYVTARTLPGTRNFWQFTPLSATTIGTKCQCCVQENFRVSILVWTHKKWPKNRAVLYHKLSFFIKQIINSFPLCEIYRKLDILKTYLWLKHSKTEKKTRRFDEKIHNSCLNPDVPIFQTFNRWSFKTT